MKKLMVLFLIGMFPALVFAQKTQKKWGDIKNRPIEVPDHKIQDIKIQDIRVDDIRVDSIEIPDIKSPDNKPTQNKISNTIENSNQRKTSPFPYPNTSNSGDSINGAKTENAQPSSTGDSPGAATPPPAGSAPASVAPKLELETDGEAVEEPKSGAKDAGKDSANQPIQSTTIENPIYEY